MKLSMKKVLLTKNELYFVTVLSIKNEKIIPLESTTMLE